MDAAFGTNVPVAERRSGVTSAPLPSGTCERLLGRQWPGSHEAHLPEDDVEQFRQFIDRRIGRFAIGVGQTVGLVLRIRTYEDGLGGTMDVPAQNASGLPVTVLTRQDDRIHLEMRQIAASFDGTLDLANGTISGTWRQGGVDTPFVLRRAAQ